MTTAAVLGPGGVGGLLAAVLSRAGTDVTVIAREATAERIAADGIHVQSVRLGSFRARPRARATLEEPAEILFVATKAVGLEAALQRIRRRPGVVVPLLNGLDHLALLRCRFDAETVCAGSIRVESDRPRAGEIVHTSPFLRIDLAADDAGLTQRLPPVTMLLRDAGIPACIGQSEAAILWGKLVRLNALALTTSASDQPLGYIRTEPAWRAALEQAIAEGAAVARAEGADIDAAVPLGELHDAHEGLRSSMQRDIAAGREPELDAIAGSVLRAAARHGIPVPTIARLAGEVAARAGLDPPRA